MPRYGPTSFRQNELLGRGPDCAQQRRTQDDSGDHLADDARLADLAKSEPIQRPARIIATSASSTWNKTSILATATERRGGYRGICGHAGRELL